jgi:hypothetical protein
LEGAEALHPNRAAAEDVKRCPSPGAVRDKQFFFV